jgi:putative ABC transport system permease protein
VGLESLVLVVTGVLAGSLASLVTVLPYSYARTGDWIPDTSVAVYAVVVVVAAVLTFAASVGSARVAVRVPAVQAAA